MLEKERETHFKRGSSEKNDASQRHAQSYSKDQKHKSPNVQSFSLFTSENGAADICNRKAC